MLSKLEIWSNLRRFSLDSRNTTLQKARKRKIKIELKSKSPVNSHLSSLLVVGLMYANLVCRHQPECMLFILMGENFIIWENERESAWKNLRSLARSLILFDASSHFEVLQKIFDPLATLKVSIHNESRVDSKTRKSSQHVPRIRDLLSNLTTFNR